MQLTIGVHYRRHESSLGYVMHARMVSAFARVEHAGPWNPYRPRDAAAADRDVGTSDAERERRARPAEVDAHAGDDLLATIEAKRHQPSPFPERWGAAILARVPRPRTAAFRIQER